MSVETQAQLQDLAGNAVTTTVVGVVDLAALSRLWLEGPGRERWPTETNRA